MPNIVNINKIIEIVRNKLNKNIPEVVIVKKKLDNMSNKVIQEYGANIIFIQGESYDTYDKNIINEIILKLLNKLGSFTNTEYNELKASIFEELRGGKLIIADIVQNKYINEDNKKKQDDYFNMNEKYSEYLENKTSNEKYRPFLEQVKIDTCLEDAIMLFITSMGSEFQDELKKFQDMIPEGYKNSRPYNDIALGKAIMDKMLLLDCDGNMSINTDDNKFNSIEKINTVFDLLCSSYSNTENIIGKSLADMLKELPPLNVDIPYYMPEFKYYVKKYNDVKQPYGTRKKILLHIITKCKLLLTGDRIETLKLWSDRKNSILYDVVPLNIQYSDILIKKETFDRTKVFNIFSHCIVFPENEDFLYKNDTISTDPKYKYIGMICIKIDNDVKVILVYKKIIDLIQTPDYKFITPFDNRMDLSIIVDSSKYHNSSFNNANYKLILSCINNNKQDITLKEGYDIYNGEQIPTTSNHVPIQQNKIHVYYVEKSNPKIYLFSKFSKNAMINKYRELGLANDIKLLNHLQEIPYSLTMIKSFLKIYSDLCSPYNCVTFTNILLRNKQKYNDLKLYLENISKNNYKYISSQRRKNKENWRRNNTDKYELPQR